MTGGESVALARGIGRRTRDILRLTAQSAWRGFQGFYHSDNLTYAASIAYYALLSLFPFFLLAFALLGRVTADEQDRNTVLEFVLRYFPSQFEFVTSQLDAFNAHATTFGVAGTVALVWGALGVFGAISTAVNYAWGVEKQRSFWKHKLFSFLMLLVAGLIVVLSVPQRATPGSPAEHRDAPGASRGRDLVARGIDSILVDNEVGGAIAAWSLPCIVPKRLRAAIAITLFAMRNASSTWASFRIISCSALTKSPARRNQKKPALAVRLIGRFSAASVTQPSESRRR